MNVIAVTKIGKDVLTSTNPNDFIFHSAYNTFKIIVEGTKSATVPAGSGLYEITQAHNLNFIPLVTAFWITDGGSAVYPVENIKTDATNITFYLAKNVGSVDVNIRYFCLEKI